MIAIRFIPSGVLAGVCVSLGVAGAAFAAPPPDYGFDWATIGDPGNVPTDPAVKHPNFPRPLGAVDYKYRLTRTEVTYAQQLEFLNAYGPYMSGGDQLVSWGEISYFGMSGGVPDWRLNEGSENRPGKMSPRLWARYANWLHNDKALTADAFESGAYDTSTFGRDENGDLTDQLTRSAGARYWIPSIDEWIKGGYWDPNKNGEGEGGYWLYPNGSDTPSVPGLPEEGGETNNGFGDLLLDVGSYPDTQTPWGLLDYSGGEAEVAERLNSISYLALGSRSGDMDSSLERLGRVFSSFPDGGFVTLRVASSIPAPSSGAVFIVLAVTTHRRRNR